MYLGTDCGNTDKFTTLLIKFSTLYKNKTLQLELSNKPVKNLEERCRIKK